jgi:hypothetical protein
MQSKLTKFHHAYDRYWEKVERALAVQYHRPEGQASDWVADKMQQLSEEGTGDPVIPSDPPERMAQEIFMERAE